MRKFFAALTALFIAVSLAQTAGADVDCAAPVQIESGQIQGISEKDSAACAWKGIPYAAPPVGELRWKAPEPAVAWDGVYKADKFGARCMQKGVMAAENLTAEGGMSEDCLFVNVWRPKKEGKFPVMVWVHGGGYYGGSADSGMYWGDRLATAGDLVVVSLNYRLNVFGFYSSPALKQEDKNGSTGSYATLDQVAALQWVHDNIESFGGDPGNVTIFGESAGGWSICTLVATPLAKGLIHRAILESGGCTRSQSVEKSYDESQKVAKALDCDQSDLACLRKLSAKKVLDDWDGGMGSGPRFMPVQDGYVLTDTPYNMILSGNYNHVPFMAGSNRDEFGKAMKLKKEYRNIPPEEYESALIEKFKMTPEQAARLVMLYPLADFGNRPVEAYGRMFGSDLSLGCPTYDGLLAASDHQQELYYYNFNYDDVALGEYMGAFHALEIPFVFDSFDRVPMNVFFTRKNMAAAKKLGHIIQSYWINFAKTGDPNGEGLPQWPRFAKDDQNMMVFDTEVRAEKASCGERCAFWREWSKEPHSSTEMLR